MPYDTLGLGFKYTIDPNANPLICEASLGLTVQPAPYVPFQGFIKMSVENVLSRSMIIPDLHPC